MRAQEGERHVSTEPQKLPETFRRGVCPRFVRRRAGIRTVILPKRNETDIDDIPEEVRRELVFIFADRMEEVLEAALRQRVTEPPVAPPTNGQEAERDRNGVVVEDAREGVETVE